MRPACKHRGQPQKQEREEACDVLRRAPIFHPDVIQRKVFTYLCKNGFITQREMILALQAWHFIGAGPQILLGLACLIICLAGRKYDK